MAVGGLWGLVARARAHRSTAGIVGLSLLIAACGNGGGGDDNQLSLDSTVGESTTSDTDIPDCADVRNTVAFAVFGAAVEGDPDEAARQMGNPDDYPPVRAGAADVIAAYRHLGYKTLYISWIPAGTQIGDRPLPDALTLWLGFNRFPIGEDTEVWAWDGEGHASVALIEKMAYLTSDGASIDVGYAGDPEMTQALISGGIPEDRVFSVGAVASGERGTSVPEDFGEHLRDVQALNPVCEQMP